MKILYIAHERQAAKVAAQALRRMLPDVRLTWADTPGAALAWFGSNRDAAAVIVDAEVVRHAGATFIEQVREVTAAAGVLVIGLEQLQGMSVAVQGNISQQQAQHESALARATRISIGLQERMLELEADIQGSAARCAAQTAANDQLVRRETELSQAVAELGVVRAALEQKLAAAEAARQHAVQHAAGELAAADERLATIENRLDREIALRAGLEEQLAAAARARDAARQMHDAELSALNTRLAEEDAQHGASLARSTRICTALQERLLELEHASRGRDERHAEDAAGIQRLSARERTLQMAVDEAVAARTALDHQLSAAESCYQRAAAELASATGRCSTLEQQLNEHTTTTSILEERLAAAQAARQDSADRHAAELASLTARARELEAKYEAASSRNEQLERQLQHITGSLESTRIEWQLEAAAWSEQRARHETQARAALTELAGARHTAERRLADTGRELEQTLQRAAADSAAAAERHAAVERRLAEECAARTLLQERIAAAEAGRNAVQVRLARREAAQREGEARAAAELAAAAERQCALRAQLEAKGLEVTALQQETAGLRRQLNALQARADALRRHAAQVPALQLQLEKSHKENRRQFERAPYGLFECAPDGGITRLNHTLARLLGYRGAVDLNATGFVATVFETPTDLQWLLERALETGAPESIDTTLRTRDRRRIAVRLHADARQGSVTIAVADLTKLHEIEQKLREAQRLEAVGRVASEVAATCDTLLSDVSHEGRQWLAALDSDTRLRQRGELLLGDVSRAAGFLRQFVVYGHQQINNVSPVDLPGLLREMAPILKRVLGDDIRLLLPRTAARFDIDVDAERVERILVTVANWARERMPQGGRVKIQLATTVLDQKFVASHPKVRPGTHVVITITEIQGAVWPALPVRLPAARTPQPPVLTPAHKPGMDLGPLLAIIGDAGGHLWMSAEPAGNVTLQIHLPKRTHADGMAPAVRGAVHARGRQLARWFRH